MPFSGRDMKPISSRLRINHSLLGDIPCLIENERRDTAPQDDHHFIPLGGEMPVRLHERPALQTVQHPVDRVTFTLMKIVVFPQPWTLFGITRRCIQQRFVDHFHLHTGLARLVLSILTDDACLADPQLQRVPGQNDTLVNSLTG